MSELTVHSTFTTIQGEGMWAGHPAVFVRLQGCNLRCPWCDEPNALEFNRQVQHADKPMFGRYPTAAIFERIRKDAQRTGFVVITGGEPTAQNFSELFVMLQSLEVEMISVETNGTLFSEWLAGLVSLGLWVTVSPKPKERVPDPRVLKLANELKLIIERPEDIEAQLSDFAPQLAGAEIGPRVFLQAEDSKTQQVLPAMLEAVQRYPKLVRISPRLHKLWNLP